MNSLICLGLLVIAAGSGIIQYHVPQDFVVQAIITIISVFVVSLIMPFRFLYQCILAFAASIGETLIILLILKPALSPVLFTILFGLLISNFIELQVPINCILIAETSTKNSLEEKKYKKNSKSIQNT